MSCWPRASRGTPPTTQSAATGLRAFARWTRTLAVVDRADLILDFDTAFGYAGAKLFAEVGCMLTFANASDLKTTVELLLGSGAVGLTVGGRQSGVGKNNDFYQSPARLVGLSFPFDAPFEHVRMAIELRPGVLKADVTYAGGNVVQTVVAPTPVASIALDCGIMYADDSDAKLLHAEVKNVEVTVCSP